MLNDFFTTTVHKTHKLILQAATQQEITNPTIIIGLSGGPDSVFLLQVLDACRALYNVPLIAAHLNHGWRAEAEQDADFCKALCEQRKIPFVQEHAATFIDQVPYNGSQEEVGRKLRRLFFEQLAREHNGLVALAHHADDQEETFIIRLLRGSSLQGLCSMRAIALPYVRPLLTTEKTAILSYLHEASIEYVIDETNTSQAYLRNRIRTNVIPALQGCDERFGKKLASTIAHLQETENYLAEQTYEAYILVFNDNESNHGKLEELQPLHTVIKKRLLLSYLILNKATFSPSDGLLLEMLSFLDSPRGGIHTITEQWHIHKKSDAFWLCKSCNQKISK